LKTTHSKPSIVFCHGIWADGSCFEVKSSHVPVLSHPDVVINVIRAAAKALQEAAAAA